MPSLRSHFLLIDLQSSWKSANQVPISTLAYLQNSSFVSSVSSSFRRTPRTRKAVASLKSSSPSFRFPEIRRPSDLFPSGNGSSSNSPNLALEGPAAAELEMFLELVPARMRNELYAHAEIGNLIEVVMDLGRQPIARFPSGDWVISEQPVQPEDLSHAISKVGDFSDDNRSGINSSLHRISAIRNRKLEIIGLTCRVGRAVSGSAKTVHDLVAGGGSILVIGPPGVGKTTLIREIARMLADEHGKRVVIVDTSNEIGGDGDVPHAGIGRARRMQVPNVHMQHSVMIEAVENHMPQTIIIDEIGTELEALAASTIAQRGVQLVGTAHGTTIDSIIKNPSLQILVGGIESVTLGDEVARKRKVQKTVLERKGPPTFTCAVELISKTECRVHHRLDATVDAILAGKSPLVENRHRGAEDNESLKLTSTRKNQVEGLEFANNKNLSDEVGSDEDAVDYTSQRSKKSSISRSPRRKSSEELELANSKNLRDEVGSDEDAADYTSQRSKKNTSSRSLRRKSSPVSVYSYKILESDLLQVAKVMGHQDKVDVTDDVGKADAILVSSQELEQNPWIRGIAKFYKLPVYVLKTNTMAQMVKAVNIILEMDSNGSKSKKRVKSSAKIEIEGDAPKRKPSLEEMDALEEVRLAIEYIVIPGGEPVELLPRPSDIVARQLELVESYQLAAENAGTESNPRLQILPQRLIKKSSSKSLMTSEKDESFKAPTGRRGGTTVARLPLLPE